MEVNRHAFWAKSRYLLELRIRELKDCYLEIRISQRDEACVHGSRLGCGPATLYILSGLNRLCTRQASAPTATDVLSAEQLFRKTHGATHLLLLLLPRLRCGAFQMQAPLVWKPDIQTKQVARPRFKGGAEARERQKRVQRVPPSS